MNNTKQVISAAIPIAKSEEEAIIPTKKLSLGSSTPLCLMMLLLTFL